jgi:hypothetical protein
MPSEHNPPDTLARIEELEKYRTAQEAKNLGESHQRAMDRLQSSNETYTKMVMAAGYAGFLAFWAKSTVVIPPLQHAWIGSLFLLSLLFFISWEVIKSTMTSITVNRLVKVLGDPATPESIASFAKQASAHDRQMGRLWIFFFVPSASFGFSSGIWLLGWYISTVWAGA